MAAPLAKQVLVAIGGDVATKYGTPVWRKGLQARGGEISYTFTRTGTGLFVVSDVPNGGTWKALTAAQNAARVEQAIDPVNNVLQNYLLLEAAGTNLVENSDYEADAVGSSATSGATVARDSGHAFNGSWSAKVTTANQNGSGILLQTRAGTNIAATAGTIYSWSAWVYAGGSTDGAAVGKSVVAEIDWFNGGTGNGSTIGSPVTLVQGWQRISVSGAAPANTTNTQPRIAMNGAQGVIAFWVDVPQFEASVCPTSAIPTGTGAVTRNTERFGVSFSPSPGPYWFYARFIDRTAPTLAGGFPDVFGIQAASGSLWKQFVYGVGAATGYRGRNDTGSPPQNDTGPDGKPSVGQLSEVLLLCNADRTIQLRVSLNGAADMSATGAAVATAYPSQYGTAPVTLYVGENGSGLSNLLFSRVLVGTGTPTQIADVRSVL